MAEKISNLIHSQTGTLPRVILMTLIVLSGFYAAAPQVSAGEPLSADSVIRSIENQSRTLEEAYQDTIHLARKQQFDESLRLLDFFDDAGYESGQILLDRMTILHWAGRNQDSVALFENLADRPELPMYVLEAAAGAYRQLNRPQDELEAYRKILVKNPHHPASLTRARQIALELNLTEEARKYSDILSSRAANPDFFRDMLITHIRGHDFERVIPLLPAPDETTHARIPVVFYEQLKTLSRENLSLVENARQRKTSIAPLYDSLIRIAWMSQYSDPHFRNAHELDKDLFPNLPRTARQDYIRHLIQSDQLRAAEDFIKILEAGGKPDQDIALLKARLALARDDTGRALSIVSALLENVPRHIEALFLKGEIHEAESDLIRAVETYNSILDSDPKNRAAIDLKMRALLNLGATSVVLERVADDPDRIDPVLEQRALGNVPMHNIHWEDAPRAHLALDQAREQLTRERSRDYPRSNLLDDYKRAQWDRVLALRLEDRMEEVIILYENFLARGMDIPDWIHIAAADAYLYVREPRTALELYTHALGNDPDSLNIRMSIYHTLVELGRFNEARELLENLDDETPVKTWERGLWRPNWDKADITINRAWLYLYEDRFTEALQIIDTAQDVSPMNTNLRTARAHTYLWRGWPRKALEEFNIIRTLDPDHIAASIGYAHALNANQHKLQARLHIERLWTQHPTNTHIHRTIREFEVEDMRLISIDANLITEHPGADEWTISVRGEMPAGYKNVIFASITRRETTSSSGDVITRRAVVGNRWQVNNAWQLIGGIAADYETGNDTGILARVVWTPDDHWRINAGYEENLLSIPLRSRQDGVSADRYDASVTYRKDEGLEASAGVARVDFDDGNVNDSYTLRVKKDLYRRAYWKWHLGAEAYHGSYSKQDVSYFSPESVSSVYLIPGVEHTWYRLYEKALVDRLDVGIGHQWQKNFDSGRVSFVQYEQDFRLSDTQNFLWGIRYGHNRYDAETVDSLNVYTNIRLKF